MTESGPPAPQIHPEESQEEMVLAKPTLTQKWREAFQDFFQSKVVRWSALGVSAVGVVSFFGNFATIMGMFGPPAASSVQVEELQTELVQQRQMISQLLQQTSPGDQADLSPVRIAERSAAAVRVVTSDPEAADAIARGDFRTGFLALKARADEQTADAAIAWRDLGALAFDRDPGIALEAYRQAARIDPGHYETWISLAELEFDQEGNLSAAKAAAATAVDVSGDLTQRLSALSELALLEFEAGELESAGQRYEQTVLLLRPLVAEDPDRDDHLYTLSDALIGIGDIKLMSEDFAASDAAYKEALAIRRQRLAAFPGDPSRARDVSTALEGRGELALATGDYLAAEEFFAESLAIDRQLAEDMPESLRARRDVAVSLESYGDILMALDQPQDALNHYRESLKISRLLMASHPLNAEFREDVGYVLAQLGTAQMSAGQEDAAAASFAEMVALMRSVQVDQNDDLRGQLLLCESLARAAAGTGNEAYADEARAILEMLRDEGRLGPDVESYVAEIETLL